MPKFAELANEYKQLWERATIRPEKARDVADAASKLRSFKSRYDQVSSLTTVPWYVVGLIHYLEASFDFTTHLHNGNSLRARTVDVPRGRPPGNAPFSWEQSAVDALTMHGLQRVDNWPIGRIAYQLEAYNGWGYRRH